MHVDAPLRLPAADAPSQADRAYLAIRDLIVSLELRPGSVINERELMERVGGTRQAREQLERRERGRDQVLAPVHGAVLARQARPDDERARMAEHTLAAQVLGDVGEALAILEGHGHGRRPRRPGGAQDEDEGDDGGRRGEDGAGGEETDHGRRAR